MKISVIGLGYVGLPTAVILANAGHQVVGVDINPNIIETINAGDIHIVEPGLKEKVKKLTKAKKLSASTEIECSDVFIISVPTPLSKSKKPELKFIKQAVKNFSKHLKKGNLVILESTSPIGTSEKISSWIKNMRPDLMMPSPSSSSHSDINIAHCPERVLPGNVLHELVYNDRIIGGISEACSQKTLEVYKTFVKANCYLTNARAAEFCKLAENAYRDVNIAFANELSLISNKLMVDPWEVISLANKHPRVNILQPGPGVGGHCIAVDPMFIAHSAPNDSKLIQAARAVNNYKPQFVFKQIKEAINRISKPTKNITISAFGLAYKPNIDDLRESPALQITENLKNLRCKQVMVIEPNIRALPDSLNDFACIEKDINQATKADILVFLVSHNEFKILKDYNFKSSIVIDACGLLVDS
jgi:UDP-N-acetyl-D-mannosaminuronic acid dehydrogenase